AAGRRMVARQASRVASPSHRRESYRIRCSGRGLRPAERGRGLEAGDRETNMSYGTYSGHDTNFYETTDAVAETVKSGDQASAPDPRRGGARLRQDPTGSLDLRRVEARRAHRL